MEAPRNSHVMLVLMACAVGALAAMALKPRHAAPVEMKVAELVRVQGGPAVLVLLEARGVRKLPVPVSKADAALIERALEGRRGLLPASLEALGGRVLRASIDQVAADRSFSGHLSLASGLRELWVEARAGEALALALAAGAPIVADAEVLEEAGVSPGDLRGRRARDRSAAAEPAPVQGI